MQNRTLFFGDNLEILREKIPDEFFDLIYLDPPFNSKRSYNVLFKEADRDEEKESQAQIKAFEDSWHWNEESKKTFDYLVTKTRDDISNLMLALEKMVGHNDVLAYLTMMTVRLIELHRVLKKTGSLYLHCDPTASHYLKIVLDTVFGKKNFRNELVWLYKGRELSHKQYNRKHDIILFYTKTNKYIFNWDKILEPLEESSRKALARHKDDKGYFIVRYKKGGGFAPINKEGPETYRQYLPKGVPPRDWFYADYARKSEQLGYPTQKPLALLERIITASSQEGDWVFDPFCGCGTTVAAAEKLGRNWVGIDITTLAINLIKRRMKEHFNLGNKQIIVDGLPTDVAGAKELFRKDPFQFEYWALDLINAMPAKSKTKEQMRGADKGIDGVIRFIKDSVNGKFEYGKAVVQVKGGKVQRRDIATLKGDVEREKADAGIFVTLKKPTRPMEEEAVDAGRFTIPMLETSKIEFPKIQIITIEEILMGQELKLPQGMVRDYNKKAQEIKASSKEQQGRLDIKI